MGSAERKKRDGKIETTLWGFVINILLAGVKFLFGVIFKSPAVLTDGLNSLSDSLTSVLSSFSLWIAKKPADEAHPFGHARSEYIGTMLFAVFVMSLGLGTGYSSVRRLFEPEALPLPSPLLLVLMCVSAGVKAGLFFFYRARAQQYASDLLRLAAQDSAWDVLLSLVLLIGLSLRPSLGPIGGARVDAALALLISILILLSGIQILRRTLDRILGYAPSGQVVHDIEKAILSMPKVKGIHDLLIHDYGLDRLLGSVHVELPPQMSLLEAHDCADHIERRIAKAFGIQFLVHLDPVDDSDQVEQEAKLYATSVLKEYDSRLELHDFRLLQGRRFRNLCFDVRLPLGMSEAGIAEGLRQAFLEKNSKDNAVITIEQGYLGLPYGEVEMD